MMDISFIGTDKVNLGPSGDDNNFLGKSKEALHPRGLN